MLTIVECGRLGLAREHQVEPVDGSYVQVQEDDYVAPHIFVGLPHFLRGGLKEEIKRNADYITIQMKKSVLLLTTLFSSSGASLPLVLLLNVELISV